MTQLLPTIRVLLQSTLSIMFVPPTNPADRQLDAATIKSLLALGHNYQSDFDFQIHDKENEAGNTMVGTLRLKNSSQSQLPPPQMVLQGFQFTVVCPPYNKDDFRHFDVNYLLLSTSENRELIHQEIPVKSTSVPGIYAFVVDLPWDMPQSLHKTLVGGNPFLPSQCEVRYLLSAWIPESSFSGKRALKILPKLSSEVHHTSLQVTVGNMIPLFKSYFCGLWNEPITTYQLQSDRPSLVLTAGQAFTISLIDPKQYLASVSPLTVKFTQTISWTAKNQAAQLVRSWGIEPNCSLPTTVQPSFTCRLIQVRHELVVYCEAESHIMASTVIPVKIVRKIM